MNLKQSVWCATNLRRLPGVGAEHEEAMATDQNGGCLEVWNRTVFGV